MSITVIRDIVYASPGGQELRLDLHIPDTAPRPMPVVVGIPGGGWQRAARESACLLPLPLGMAVAGIEYRTSQVATAPANVQDCKSAVRWLRTHAAEYGFDTSRIGACGSSAGGHLTALLALATGVPELEPGDGLGCTDSRLQAVCAVCGPCDLARMGDPSLRARNPGLGDVTDKYLGGPTAERRDLARLVSPLTYVRRDAPPMMLVHGDADPVVPIEESEILYAALKKAGADVLLLRIPGGGHSRFDKEMQPEFAAFFTRVFGLARA